MILGKKPHIIIVDNSLHYTGALKAILASSVALSNSFEFVFVLPKRSRIAQLVRDHEFRVHTLPFVELSTRPRDVFFYLPFLIKNGFSLSRFVKLYRARIVHTNDYYNLVGVVAKVLQPSVKLVSHIRKLPDSSPLLLNRFWLFLHSRFSDQVICVSKAVQKQLGNQYTAALIHDGIQSEEKYPPRRYSNQNRPQIKLLYLGHFIIGKGQDYALEAFRRAYSSCKNIRLKFVGGDMGLRKNREFRESLQRKAFKWDIADVVEFDGFAHDVEKEIKDADIALNFSESESFSFTCLEALYYGAPLIASDSGGPSELFEDGRSGYLVGNGDILAMAKAIVYLTENPEERQKYSAESRELVRKTFPLKRTTGCLNKLYKKML